MTTCAVDILNPSEAADAAKRLAALRRLMERALVEGDAAERVLAADLLDRLDRREGGLDAALGLGGPGWNNALRRHRQDRRDADLRHLRRTCWPEETANAAAIRMAEAWDRYARTRWPRDRRAGIAPEGNPLATFYALMDRGQEPLSARRIREILAPMGCGGVGDHQRVEIANPTADDGGKRR